MSLSAGPITRRAALGVAGAAAAGYIAFGPRGGAGARVPSGRLVLDYWEKWTGHEGRAMERVVEEFNQSQDKLWVRYLVTGTIHQKALIAIAGGVVPDIIGLNAYNVPTYAKAGAVVALDELARPHGLKLDDYAPGMRSVMTFGGTWWATVNTGG